MLTEFKDAGIPTKIDQGTIWIAKDSTPVKKGEAINEKLASILGKLDIKPVEAGISLVTALESGTVYAEEEMIIDVEKIRNVFAQFHTKKQLHYQLRQHMLLTADNISQILSKASQSARSVSVESGFMTDETKEGNCKKQMPKQKQLQVQAKDYTPA